MSKVKGTMDRQETTARRYWDAIGRLDAETMADCYAHDATFEDPVFQLQGPACGMMWRMLFQGARDLEIKPGKMTVQDGIAHGRLDAWYTFTATGRKVHNRIETRLVLRNGKIIDHHDRFDFYKWSRQALGVKGWLLGWTPLVRGAVRRQARKRLEKWMTNQ